MKRSIITTLILAASMTAFSQKKETFQLNPTEKVSVNFTLSFTADQLNDYFFVQQYGMQAISTSDKLSGAQITKYAGNDAFVRDSINRVILKVWQKFVKERQDKFTADTTAKYRLTEKAKVGKDGSVKVKEDKP